MVWLGIGDKPTFVMIMLGIHSYDVFRVGVDKDNINGTIMI